MDINVIALAIPVFFLLIGIEVGVAWKQKRAVFRFPIAIADLSCGIGNQVSAILFGGALFSIYVWVYDAFALVDMSDKSVAVWTLGFLLTDFVYYLWHRVSHRSNVIWAAHVVHHHSQDYNLAVALRQAWFTQFSNMAFFYALALLGVPPVVFAVSISVNTLYQFWIHTQTINTLGPLEWVINTPSHHRVHHGINPQYIDKNYAGVFIIWDRLLGTFAKESDPVVYGTVTPFESTNPLWANFVMWRELGHRAKACPRFVDKLAVFFGPPEWSPTGMKPIPDVSEDTFVKYTPEPPAGAVFHVCVQFLLVTALLVTLLLFQKQIPTAGHIVGGAMIIWTTMNFGGLFEQKRWTKTSEWLRLLFLPAFAAVVLWLTGLSGAVVAGGVIAAIGIAAMSFRTSLPPLRRLGQTQPNV